MTLVVLAAGVFFAPMIGQEPAVAGPRTDAALVDSTNDLRAARGLPRMKVSATLSKLMDSPPHRANILRRKANLFGVGTYISQGRIWVTVNFEQTTRAGRRPKPLTAWRP